VPYKDPATRRAKQRDADRRYRRRQALRRVAEHRPRRAVQQVASPAQKGAWIREQPAWSCAYPGSALLADLAIRARAAGLYHRSAYRRRVEASLWRYIERMIEGDALNER
jgi:hypothetical protein